MKAWQARDPGGIDGLALIDLPKPEPGLGEVRVRLTAATLNYRDLLMIERGYGSRQIFPLIPASDAAGVVDALGTGVGGLQLGDRVLASFFPHWPGGTATEARLRPTLGGTLEGVLCEYRVFNSEAVVRTPEHLSDVEAAALPCAGLTAWNAVTKAGVQPGDVVLTQGTGGVSLFAVQFAKLAGARVIATTSSDAKMERLKALGADETINYLSERAWGKRARSLTGGRGVDLVVEVGGMGTLDESIRALKVGGTIGFIGVLAGQAETPPRLSLMVMQQQRLQGVTVGSTEDLQNMVRGVAEHQLTPVIDQVFAFKETPSAFRRLASAAHVGKIAIAIGKES